MKKLRYFALLALLFSLVFTTRATTRYVAQSAGATTCNGVAQTAITPATWNATAESPGDVTWIAGTLSSAITNGTLMTFSWSGTSANPLVLNFCSGAVITTSGYWGPNGAIYLGSNSWITINGQGTGTIQNTGNGSNLANQGAGNMLSGGSISNVIVENLIISNCYVYVSPDENANIQSTGGISFSSGSVNNVTIQGNTVHDCPSGIYVNGGSGSNVTIQNNTVSHANWGIACAACNLTNVLITNNSISNTSYDDPSDFFHHNGIIMFPQPGNTCTNCVISNNRMNALTGHTTAHIFIDPTSPGDLPGIKIYNNVLSGGSPANAYITVGIGVSSSLVVNNTISGTGAQGISGQLKPTFKNNIVTLPNVGIFLNSSYTSPVSDYNDFYALAGSGGIVMVAGGSTYNSVAAWVTGTGLDTHSIITNPNLTATFTLPTGSPAIGVGTNLTSLGIAGLNVGAPQTFGVGGSCGTGCVPRPATGNWDMGAYPTSALAAGQVYLAQNAAGSANGSSCANARAYTYFNSAANWGNGAAQIGPGTTVHLCGTITAAAGVNLLGFNGNGTNGSAITLLFENGAVLQAPYFPQGTGAIAINGHQFVLVDGGTNGIIQNTSNGTPGGSYTFNQATSGIQSCAANNEIRNLSFLNLYVKTNTTVDAPNTPDGEAGIVCNGGSNILVHNNVFNGMAAGMVDIAMGSGDTGVQFYNNECTVLNLCIEWAQGNVATGSFYVYGNRYHDVQAWDDTSGGNAYHHNFLHHFGCSGGVGPTAIYIHDNYFYGNPGGTSTAGVFLEGGSCLWSQSGTSYWWNNVGAMSVIPGLGYWAPSGRAVFYNNTAIGSHDGNHNCMGFTGSTSIVENNVLQGCAQMIAAAGATGMGTIDFNTYAFASSGNPLLQIGSANTAGGFGSNLLTAFWTISASPGCLHFFPSAVCDAHSSWSTTALANLNTSTGAISSGFVGLGAGANLTSLCTGPLVSLCSDTTLGNTRTPVARPNSAWTTGAYQAATGSAPVVSFSPTVLTFGTVIVGSTSPSKPVVLTNTGGSSLSITSIALGGTNPADFAQTNNCNTSINAGGSCTINVTCTPLSGSSFSANVSVTDNAAGSPQTVPLTCTGSTATATIAFSPTSIAFAARTVGTSSAATPVTVTNNGSGTLIVNGITITGTNATSFSQTNNCSSVVSGGGICTIQVTFSPKVAGVLSASVSVTDNAAGSPQTVPLTGTGNGVPAIAFNPSSLAFGNQAVSVTSSPQSTTVTNVGSAALTISAVSLTGANSADYSISADTCITTLAVNATCSVSITFTPSATGSRTASISFTDNAIGSPQAVALTGTGTQAGTGFSPTSFAFGSLSVNTTSSPQTTTLTNTGSATLNISSITITGANASDFAISSKTCGATLGASLTCTVSATFTPSIQGAESANLSFADNAPASPQTVPMTGTGLATSLTVTPSSLTFPTTTVGAFAPTQLVRLANVGNTTIAITSTLISGTNAADFSQTNNCPTVLATIGNTGSTCTIIMSFKPSATGARTANLVLTNGAPTSPQTVPLTGTGAQSGVTLAPTTVNFPATPINTTSIAVNVTLTNSGTATLNISNIVINGTDPSYFAISSNGCGATLAVNANCVVAVTFTPQSAISAVAALSFTDDAPGSPQQAGLFGLGTFLSVSLSPTSLTFPNTAVSTPSASLSVTMTNNGNGALSISSVLITGANAADYSQSNNCGTSLAGGGSCLFQIIFTPSGTGSRVGTLSITDSGPTSPDTVSLQGTGFTPTPAVTLNVGSIAFGNQTVSTTSNPQVITVTNTGTATLSISSTSITGANPGDFGSSTNCGFSLPVNATCSYLITFTPAAAGSRSATFNLNTNAPSSPNTVSLTGTGVSSPNGTTTPQVFGD